MESMRAKKGPGQKRYWDKFTEITGELERPPQGENSWIEWEISGEEAELILYTDGASNNQGARYGLTAFEGSRLCHSEKGPLVRIYSYGAELYPVRAALNWLVSNPQRLKDNVTFL